MAGTFDQRASFKGVSERQAESDEELIAAYQQGRDDAFTILVGRYKNQLMNFAFRYLGDYDEADDVVQETFVRVFRHKDSYQPVARFSTWIYTIASNLAKTELRKRRSLFSLGRLRRRTKDEEDREIPDNRYAADALAERSVKQALIQKALNSIHPKYREVVVLCDIQEMSYEEICAVTGLNIGTVKSRLNRGRARLREILKDILDE